MQVGASARATAVISSPVLGVFAVATAALGLRRGRVILSGVYTAADADITFVTRHFLLLLLLFDTYGDAGGDMSTPQKQPSTRHYARTT
jgi:hypothetical protein